MNTGSTGALDTLLSRIDWEYPPLADAAGLYRQADREACLQGLIDHFRTRKTPRYLFDDPDTDALYDPDVLKEADRILDHEILGYRFGADIDWHFNATSDTTRDSEWTWSLARHSFWGTLARAYRMSGDERYAREFVSRRLSASTPHGCL
ncbi:MAG TPA: heparinase II/III family protein [Spirochaetia bacterium]|nr:heparinase II/III family protein [Spirochaetia bacterium]